MISQVDVRTYYQLETMLPLVQWWQLLLLVIAVVFAASFVILTYRRDSRSMALGLAITLTALRLFAFFGILIYFLNPTLRSETRLIKDSRLAILVDTSLSMGLKDNSSSGVRRIDEVVNSVKASPTFESLRKYHEVTVYRFGETSQAEPIATFAKTSKTDVGSTSNAADSTLRNVQSLTSSRRIAVVAAAMFLISILVFIGYAISLFTNRRGEDSTNQVAGWLLSGAVFALFAGLVSLSLSDIASARHDLLTSVGIRAATPDVLQRTPEEPEADEPQLRFVEVDWGKELAPNGTSTRLGDAIQYIVNNERGGPIAGIMVVTDGRNNFGSTPSRSMAAAANAGIPIFPVGIGTTELTTNVQVADIQAPPRVFPDDRFVIKGLINAVGLEGKSIRVQLLSVDEKESEVELIEDETTVKLLADGRPSQVQFESQRSELGKRRYIIRTPEFDGEIDPRDNQRATTVEVVDQKTTVLLMAGGPTREFRFLRNQLYRDKDITLHVWLQTAQKGADQEADEMLFEFPQSREGMFQYDCVIAFDPDWRELDDQQADLLERWVAEKAGGLIVVAGPVFTPEWTRRPRGDKAIDKIRRLYPVSFYSQGSASFKLGRFGGEEAYPLGFTREGRAAEYLWLADSASDSQNSWAQFAGVFGYYAVNEPKPGADVLAYFSDPSTSIDEKLPIYLASQFYGSGRVFFQASGEMWRIRTLDVEYFQKYYLNLVRWASQGRLLRDSTRGVLLTDRQRCWMGDQITVQAMLRDAQDEPLVLPSVQATLLTPEGRSLSVELRGSKDTVRPGTYVGQFAAIQEGEYRISLPIPESPDLEVLLATVQANIPDLEKEQPQRNDALLSEFADKTQGHYYVGMSALELKETDPLSPLAIMQPVDQETFLPGTPDRFFQRKLAMWLLGLIAAALAFEWTIRRLHKLA